VQPAASSSLLPYSIRLQTASSPSASAQSVLGVGRQSRAGSTMQAQQPQRASPGGTTSIATQDPLGCLATAAARASAGGIVCADIGLGSGDDMSVTI
jgi:hypothetical protein